MDGAAGPDNGFREKLLAAQSNVEREVMLLQRRWGNAMKMDSSTPPKFTIQLQPTDPEFPYDIGEGLLLYFELGEGYPDKEPCKVSVINENLTDNIRSAIAKGIGMQARQMTGDIMIRGLLKWIDNSLTVLFECALAVSNQPAFGKPAGTTPAGTGERANSTENSDGAANRAQTEDSAAWTGEQQACLERALKEFPATMDTSERWKKIAEAVPGKTKKECVARFKELKQALQGKSADQGAQDQSQKEADAAAGQRAAAESKEWTDEQQAALEGALREFPASEDMDRQERWKKIAARVPGKNARECVERYQEVKRALKEGLEAAKQEMANTKSKGGKDKDKDRAVSVKSFKFTIEPAAPPPEEAPPAEAAPAQAAEGEDETIRLGPGGDSTGGEEGSDDEETDEEEEEEEEGGEEGAGRAGEGEEEGGGGGAKRIRPLGMEGGADGKVSLTAHHRGLQLRFGDLLLAGVGVAQLGTARVQLQCTRCSLRSDFVLGRGKEAAGECGRCKQGQRAGWRADVMHAQRGAAGYLDVEGLAVVDLLPSTLWVGCEECGAEGAIRRMRRGRRVDTVCAGCHAHMLVGFNDVSFVRVGQAARGGEDGGRKRGGGGGGRKEKELVLVPGMPLPEKGACEHYKRSFRWLRFPCCGKAYPCDICHEMDGCEPGVWANRMICGLCSTETGYSNKDCKCGNSMGASGGKAHWEGGKGCRSKTLMSNKDNKKFSNSKYKTVSRKAQREAAK